MVKYLMKYNENFYIKSRIYHRIKCARRKIRLKKRILLLFGILSVLLFLTGCTEIKQPITSESTGFWNEYIVYPLSWLIIRSC